VDHTFDDFARELASGKMSRGRALRLLGSTLLGGVLASVPGMALGAPVTAVVIECDVTAGVVQQGQPARKEREAGVSVRRGQRVNSVAARRLTLPHLAVVPALQTPQEIRCAARAYEIPSPEPWCAVRTACYLVNLCERAP
jgi:hypothetical protein